MDNEQAIALGKSWARHTTFRVGLPRDMKEMPVVPNYGWTFSLYHPPEVKENPNLDEISELSSGQMVMFHGFVNENWNNEVFCFSMVHAPNTQFFISPGFFDCLVQVPVTAKVKRMGSRRFY